ncbi:MAG: DUF2235 domain-containing protein [Chloroflexi bacterium]|nr:DUF2235 domain-containing protein [Chloroflexota bacterium]
MKRIVICLDGTSNKPDINNVTNVVKVASGIKSVDGDGIEQVVFYDQGVGSHGFFDTITGGVFGIGVTRNIREAYRFLVLNYLATDEIYFFGFSRGAFTARSLTGLISGYGILDRSEIHNIRETIDRYKSRKERDSKLATDMAHIQFLGVWDTVGAMGVQANRFVGAAGWWLGQLVRLPFIWIGWKRSEIIPEINRKVLSIAGRVISSTIRTLTRLPRGRHRFHNADLSARVKHAYQALAIDERRPIFEATLWDRKTDAGQVMEQTWFPGVHTEIGGGSPNVATSIIPLNWMAARAKQLGLVFTESFDGHVMEYLSKRRVGISFSPPGIWSLGGWANRKIGSKPEGHESVDASALDRYCDPTSKYRPKNLESFFKKENIECPQPEIGPNVESVEGA